MSDGLIKIAVIGGGAAGMICAGTAVAYGADVTVFEATDRLGKKLGITGKGRCNVTNDCDINAFMENVTRNPRFLYTALNTLSPSDTIEFFKNLGVELKTERGNRVFPVSDKAKTVVDALRAYSKGAKCIYSKVKSVKVSDDGGFTVTCDSEYRFDKVVIATGGKSYPLTGSDGSGYKLASELGHSITPLIPSLVPIECCGTLCPDMMGLSLKNVSIRILDGAEKELYRDFGEMLFTHFGVSGPMILSASSNIRSHNISELTLSIDLKPALDEATLDKRLLSDFAERSNKDFINVLGALLPTKMITPFLTYTGLDGRKKVNLITKEERKIIIHALKNFKIKLKKLRPIEEAIITSGGVEVKEVSPKTMESKLCPGLYFAGEVLDLDAYTGGFNLQIAFSTGYLAGMSAAQY